MIHNNTWQKYQCTTWVCGRKRKKRNANDLQESVSHYADGVANVISTLMTPQAGNKMNYFAINT